MSKTVDERIVEMRFDNGQFESNVKTSMNTLERLKASMKFDNSTESLKGLGKAANSIKFDNLAASVSNIESRFSILGIAGKRAIENITDSMMHFASKTTHFLTSGIINGGISRAMKLEQAHFQLQGLLKDETEVAAVMKNVNDAVDGTAYGLDAAATVASQLAASGKRAGSEMYSSLRAVAGVAAMTNSSYEDIGRIFTQVAGQGRLMGQDLLQLSSRGINAAATIATYLGKTEAEVRDMVSKGQISFETFAAAMDDAFGEHAKKANETFTGAMSNVKASLARIGAEFVSPLIVQNGPLVKFFNVLRERINDIKANIGPLADMFTGTVSKMANGVTSALKNLDITNYVKGFVNVVKSAANIFKGILSFLKPIGKAFIEIFPPAASENILKATSNFEKMTSAFKLSDVTAEKLKRTFKGLFSVLDMMAKVAAVIGKIFLSIFTSGVFTGIIDGISTVTALAGDFLTALNNGFSLKSVSSIFTGILDVLGGVLSGFSGIGDAISGVGAAILKVVTGIGNAIKTAFSWITDNISLGDIFTGLVGGGAYVALKKIIQLVEKIKEVFDGGIFKLIFGGNKKDAVSGGFDIVKKFSSVLDSVNESLQSFTKGIKVGSLVAIASAIAILASALDTISQIKAVNITKSLFAIGLMFGMLTTSFKSISKTLDLFSGKGIIKAGISLMMIAKAIGILANAMKKMSGLSFSGIVKGLIGIGGGMTALAFGLRGIDGVKVKISTIIAISVMANAMKKMSNSIVELGKMSWGEIGRGLSAMGGALTELLITLKIFEKISGFKSFTGSASLLIAVQSLDEIANALLKLGKMSWGEIGRGLSAMGGALTEVVIVSGALGKLAGFSGLLGSASIVTAVKSLNKIAKALKNIGSLSWNKIGKGLSGMGGALTEIASISGILGKLTGFSGLLGSGSILIAVQGINKIAKALKEIGSMTWKSIAKGLSGMGGALLELAAISGALGYLTNVMGLLGAATIWIGVQGLGKLANALSTIGKMSWSEIGRGLTGMIGAFLEIGAVSAALGYFTNIAGLLGAATIWVGVQGLEKLANALKKFGEMSWSEIGKGLTAMGAALSEIAIGGLLNTLSIIGSKSISEMAGPLGTLADSIKKWNDVKVPPGLGIQLGSLALGVTAFTFGGFGASAIATVAAPLGTLAESVKKWSDVTVPEGLGDRLSTLANGVRKFTFGGFGASAIAEVAAPLGTLAESVKKWSSVTVPEGLSEKLTGLAAGVKSFSFAFMGGWSLGTVIEPLGKLASAVNKWNGVSVPKNIGTQLSNLASGVKSFSFAFMGGWSLETVTGPLGQLASAVNKWNGVSIPENLPTQISNLASAIKNFSGVAYYLNGTASSLSEFPFGLLTKVVSELTKLRDFITSLSGFDASGVSTFKAALIQLGTISVNGLVSALTGAYGRVQSAAMGLMNSMAAGINIGKFAIVVSLVVTMSQCVSVIRSKTGVFLLSGAQLGKALNNGMKIGMVAVRLTIITTMLQCSTALRGCYGSFYSSGVYVAKGFANGIKAGSYSAVLAARAMANAAAKAAQKALDEHSPSKVFYKIGAFVPQGMANGINAFAGVVSSAVVSMAKSTIENTKQVVSGIGSAINSASNLDIAPTITPVLDMSELQNGNYQINSSIDLALNKPIEMLSSAMYGSQAEIIQSNLEVVDAIHGLKDDIVGGVKNAIQDAFTELAKEPAVINVQQNIDGKQFAKSTVEYYQNEVSKRSIRANRSRGIL